MLKCKKMNLFGNYQIFHLIFKYDYSNLNKKINFKRQSINIKTGPTWYIFFLFFDFKYPKIPNGRQAITCFVITNFKSDSSFFEQLFWHFIFNKNNDYTAKISFIYILANFFIDNHLEKKILIKLLFYIQNS